MLAATTPPAAGAASSDESEGTQQRAQRQAQQQQLLVALGQKMKEAQTSQFHQMRGLLKKKGGASRSLPFHGTTWHWRYCVLHPHALAIHDGHSRPKALRSAVPLKHVFNVTAATHDESGGRQFAFTLHTSLGRDWVFCCMSEIDARNWLDALRAVCTLTHGAGLANVLSGQTT